MKAKQLAIGSYSLILDGLAQEAGALLRPFIEYMELLTYFRRFPDKAESALQKTLPRAGKRAKDIEGDFQELREHLNEHASHSSYSAYALGHLLVPGTAKFKKNQHLAPLVLKQNLRDLAIWLYLLLVEATRALDLHDPERIRSLAPEIDGLKARIISAFELVRPPRKPA